MNRAGIWYLVATRRATSERPTGKHGDPVVFRVGRVTSARPLAGAVDRPDGFDLAAFWERWTMASARSC